MNEEREEKDKKLIVGLGKYKQGRGRPFKITLSKSKDGDLKIQLEGQDALSTALLYGGLEIVKEGAKRLIQKIDDLSKGPVK